MKRIIIAGLALAALMLSCKLFFNSDNQQLGRIDTASGSTGSAVIRLLGPVSSRTLLQPQGHDILPATYDVYGQKRDDGTSFRQNDQASSTIAVPYLSAGLWDFYVDAKNAGGVLIMQGATAASISGGSSTPVTIHLEPVAGTGLGLEFSIAWTETAVATPGLTGSLFVLSAGSAPVEHSVLSFGAIQNDAGLSRSDVLIGALPAGSYAVVFSLYQDWDGSSGTLVSAASVPAIVFDELLSSGQIELGADDISKPPLAPSNLAADGIDGTTIRFTWTDEALTEEGYEYSLNGGEWNAIPDSRNASYFDLGGLDPDSPHSFELRAYNSFGASLPVELSEAWTARGAADISYTVMLPDQRNLEFQGQSLEIRQGKNLAVSVTPQVSATHFRWYLNGQIWLEGPEADFCLVGATLRPGIYSLSCETTMEDRLFSKSFTFTVVASPGSVAGGEAHSLWVKHDGSLWAFGSNANGRLGIDSADPSGRPRPLRLRAATEAVSTLLSASRHSLVVGQDGTLLVAGTNGNGQLGMGNVSDYQALTPNPTFSTVANRTQGAAVKVAAGYNFSAVLRADGSVWTTGSNLSGQLGDSGVAPSGRNGFGRLDGLSPIVDIAAGNDFCLAVTADGSVLAWGSNTAGQLGQGSAGGQYGIPQAVPGISTAVAVTAGDGHSLILLADGRAMAMGDNTYGQLGTASAAQTVDPTFVKDIGGSADQQNIVALAGGQNHSLWLTGNGQVLAAGRNEEFGQLGNGSGVDSTLPVAAYELPSAAAIAAGDSHSLALGVDGKLWVYGRGSEGQLGEGQFNNQGVAVQAGILEANRPSALETTNQSPTITLAVQPEAYLYRIKIGSGAWVESTSNVITVPYVVPVGVHDLWAQIGDGSGYWSSYNANTITINFTVGAIGPAGGILFYENPNHAVDGWRWLEAWTADEPGTYQWKTSQTSTPGTATAIGNGYANTYSAMLGAEHPAGEVARNVSHGGYSDWFLPSKDELNLMFDQKVVIGNFEPDLYWSSSEGNIYFVSHQDFGNGYPNYSYKDDYIRVRVIRVYSD
jgi:alpha-tubulin suppressor-like RCC1 family protein